MTDLFRVFVEMLIKSVILHLCGVYDTEFGQKIRFLALKYCVKVLILYKKNLDH